MTPPATAATSDSSPNRLDTGQLHWATATRTTRSQDREPARLAMRRCETWAKHAGVPLRRVRAVEGAGRLFSTPSRPACGRPPAAAVLGRHRHPDSGTRLEPPAAHRP